MDDSHSPLEKPADPDKSQEPLGWMTKLFMVVGFGVGYAQHAAVTLQRGHPYDVWTGLLFGCVGSLFAAMGGSAAKDQSKKQGSLLRKVLGWVWTMSWSVLVLIVLAVLVHAATGGFGHANRGDE